MLDDEEIQDRNKEILKEFKQKIEKEDLNNSFWTTYTSQ